MNTILHILPLIIFFVSYQLFNIYVATKALMISSVVSIPLTWILSKQIRTSDVITLSFIWIFGTATLLFQNPIFIKLKVTIIFWLLAVGMIVNLILNDKPATFLMLQDNKIDMSEKSWFDIDYMTIAYSTIMGLLNLVIFCYLSEASWVNFKTFGLLASSVVFSVFVAIYISQNANSVQ